MTRFAICDCVLAAIMPAAAATKLTYMWKAPPPVLEAFSSEADTGSREENASNQNIESFTVSVKG
jgi:hypothetical protein